LKVQGRRLTAQGFLKIMSDKGLEKRGAGRRKIIYSRHLIIGLAAHGVP
jgi:hypothetical protein